MSVSVSMPQLGESVTEGTVTRWLKREGEHVEADEPLLEVSTDKVDTEIPSPVSGVVRGISVAEDETVAVGAELAVIDEDGAAAGGGEVQAGADQEGAQTGAGRDGAAQAAGAGAGEEGAAGYGAAPGAAAPGGAQQAGPGPDAPPGAGGQEAGGEGVPQQPAAADEPGPGGAGGAADAGYGADSGFGAAAAGYQAPGGYPQQGTDYQQGGQQQDGYPQPDGGAQAGGYQQPVTQQDYQQPGDQQPVAQQDYQQPGDQQPVTQQDYQQPGDQQGLPEQDSHQPPTAGGYQAMDEPRAGQAPAQPPTGQAPAQQVSSQPPAGQQPQPPGAQQAAGQQPAQPAGGPAAAQQAGANGAGSPVAEAGAAEGADSPYVTPLVRKLAAEHGIDLASLTGTGVGGRIRKQDVLDAAGSQGGSVPAPSAPSGPGTGQPGAGEPGAGQQPAAAPVSAAAARPVTDEAADQAAPARSPVVPSRLRGTTERMSRARQVIAQRMIESLQTSAQLTTVVEADVTAIARLRDRAKAAFEAREGVKLSFLPFFALAVVEALKVHPKLNAVIDTGNGQVTYHDAEHLGIAVDTERGLMVPVIRNAGDLNIGGLARKISDLAERTRGGQVSPDDLSGGTFTLTNTGSRGALFDTPIINQPQVGILGTGTVVKRAVVVEDPALGEVITVRSMVYLALTYDHRLVDGADAVRFLVTLKSRLEEGAFETELGL